MEQYIRKMLREAISEKKTSIQENRIIEDLLSKNIQEGPGIQSLIDKFKAYAKQGAITASIVISLLSNDALGQEQKQEILDVAKTELSSEDIAAIKSETGLEFDDDYVKNNFTSATEEGTFNLPSEEEIKGLITKAGLPSRFIDNIYVNHVGDAYGFGDTGVMVSIRLKEEGEFNRFAQNEMRQKVLKLVLKALNNYRPDSGKGIKDVEGKPVTFNIEVLDPKGGVIGGKPLQFKS